MYSKEIGQRPPAVLHNALPVSVSIKDDGDEWIVVAPGKSLHLNFFNPKSPSIELMFDYSGQQWTCTPTKMFNNDEQDLKKKVKKITVLSFKSNEGRKLSLASHSTGMGGLKPTKGSELSLVSHSTDMNGLKPTKGSKLSLAIHSIYMENILVMSVYCPFWMVNNTNLDLQYKGFGYKNVVVIPEKSSKGPEMFSFNKKSDSKNISVRVSNNQWSDKFSLDQVERFHKVICKTSKDGLVFQLGATVQLSHGLTWQVTFNPLVTIRNSAQFAIEVCERTKSTSEPQWTLVPANTTVPFWPQSLKRKGLVFRVASTGEETIPLNYQKPISELLKLDNKYGGIFVDCLSEQLSPSVTIACRGYEEGDAPLLLANHSDFDVSVIEDAKSPLNLRRKTSRYLTWLDPNGSKKLALVCGRKVVDFEYDKVCINDAGSFIDTGLRWVMLLRGRQRLLLFTSDQQQVKQLKNENLQIVNKFTVAISRVHLSLFDNAAPNVEHHREILNARIEPGVIWEKGEVDPESEPNKLVDFKPMTVKENKFVEAGYQRYKGDPSCNEMYEDKFQVVYINLKDAEMTRPKKGQLKRKVEPGFKLEVQFSKSQMKMTASLYKLQIDNQLNYRESFFNVIFAPVPPRKTVAEIIPLPLLKVEVVRYLDQGDGVMKFKHCRALMQEVTMRFDKSLMVALGKFLSSGKDKELDKIEDKWENNVLGAIANTRKDGSERSKIICKNEAKHYFEALHLSPLKILLSYSSVDETADHIVDKAEDHSSKFYDTANAIIYLSNLSIPEYRNLDFRLGYFEKRNEFQSFNRLVQNIIGHYVSQSLKRFYAFALGMDFIGNPFGVAVDISEGFKDLFYEPIQGFKSGSDEFDEGLVIGAQSVINRTIGGVAGALSRIAESAGSKVVALTFNKKYRTERRRYNARKPAKIVKNLIVGSRAIGVGLKKAVTGIVTEPYNGWKKHKMTKHKAVGAAKGVYKGLAGLIIRPTIAVTDLFGGVFGAVKKNLEGHEEIQRLRDPRTLNQRSNRIRSHQNNKSDDDEED